MQKFLAVATYESKLGQPGYNVGLIYGYKVHAYLRQSPNSIARSAVHTQASLCRVRYLPLVPHMRNGFCHLICFPISCKAFHALVVYDGIKQSISLPQTRLRKDDTHKIINEE